MDFPKITDFSKIMFSEKLRFELLGLWPVHTKGIDQKSSHDAAHSYNFNKLS